MLQANDDCSAVACRIVVSPHDLQHMDTHTSQANFEPQLSAPLHSATSLSAAEMLLVKAQQQTRARQFAQQQEQVGRSNLQLL